MSTTPLRRMSVSLILAALCALPAARAAGRRDAGPLSRLPLEVRPLRQAIALELDPRRDEYRGTVTIDLELLRSARSIRLHGQELALEQVTLTRGTSNLPITFRAFDDQLLIESKAPLRAGTGYRLSIEFHNDFDTQANAIYKLVTGGEHYAYSQFEDVQARRAFPCFDEPSFKLPYQITLTVPIEHLALSNMPEQSTSVAGAFKTVSFKPTPPLPSYLLAIASGPMETVPIPGLSVPGRVVVPRGRTGFAAEAIAATPPLLAALERYFGQPYPFDKLDLIAVPEFWYGAMENPGAITFRERRLLLDPQTASAADLDLMRATIAHELAHMWFGNLVTMAWWDDLWLNEAFANWAETKVLDEVFPGAFASATQLAALQSAYALDSLSGTRAIRQPVESQAVLLQAADQLAYDKGQAVLRMVEQWLGADAFRRGVLSYLSRHAWGNARGSDLWNALGTTSRLDVPGVMSSLLDQSGVPVIEVIEIAPGRIRLQQRRYGALGAAAPGKRRWKLPVTLRYADGVQLATRTVLLDRPQLELTLLPDRSPDWIYPNAGESGYYRWLTSTDNLKALFAARDRLDLRERIGLPAALGAQLAAGTIEADVALDGLAECLRDPEPLVLTQAVKVFDQIFEPLAAPTTELALRRRFGELLRPLIARFGTSARPGDSQDVTKLRPPLIQMFGARAGDRETLVWARDEIKRYLDGSTAIPADLLGPLLQLAALGGDAELFDACRARLEAEVSPAERALLLGALGAFRDPALTRRALATGLQPGLGPDEVLLPAMAVADDFERQRLVFEWIEQNYTALTERLPPFVLALLPRSVDGCDLALLGDARRFFSDPAHAPPGTDRSLQQVGERVAHCVALRAHALRSLETKAGSQPER